MWQKQIYISSNYYYYKYIASATFEPTNSSYTSAKYIFAVLEPSNANTGSFAFAII